MITKKSIAAGMAGILGATGIALAAPALAQATATPSATASADSGTESTDGTAQARRQSVIDRIKEALSGLVSDGTLTDEQAGKVATTLSEQAAERGGPGGGRHGHGVGQQEVRTAAAKALNLTEDQLREKLSSATLGEVADEAGVSRDTLVKAMVAAATEQINQAVSEGNLTQERADQMLADLQTRITAQLDHSRGERGGMRPAQGES